MPHLRKVDAEMSEVRSVGNVVSDPTCCDCGGWDHEWMYRCAKHGTEYCRGCSCSVCIEESDPIDEDYDMEQP